MQYVIESLKEQIELLLFSIITIALSLFTIAYFQKLEFYNISDVFDSLLEQGKVTLITYSLNLLSLIFISIMIYFWGKNIFTLVKYHLDSYSYYDNTLNLKTTIIISIIMIVLFLILLRFIMVYLFSKIFLLVILTLVLLIGLGGKYK